MSSHRILYVGDEITLPGLLTAALKPVECHVVRCPDNLFSRTFLESDIKYTLLMFDESLADAETKFVRSLKHHEQTPVVVLKKPMDLDALAQTVRRVLKI
ncbi:MAG TPA: hypothetical protein VNA19_04420 [Pyrinomonadaceae bacterium]|jgi:DNA-binding response OmpR family regulator|nr:hypothetical protein [Pyrinomonadaceae bacterium]